jgi:hypothetical protein
MTRSCLPISARVFALFFVSLLLVGQAWAQADSSPAVERTFPCSVDVMQKALQQIGGFGGGKLPIVDGFVTATPAQLDRLERPYYQYRVHLRPVDPNTTAISVEAMISAWYADPDPARSEYRSLPSNGRLESDLLDRLQRALGRTAATSTPGTPTKTDVSRASAPTSQATPTKASKLSDSSMKPAAASQEKLDAILTQRQAVREKTAALQAQIEQLKASDRKPANASRLASVKHSGVGVMSRQNFGGPVLFRAQAEDEFEVIDLQSAWAYVRLGPDATGYIQADELALPDGLVAKAPDTSPDNSQAASSSAQRDLGFSVSREDVTVFSGDWVRLKGKKVLFVYAQPRGLLSDMASQDAKLGYAKRIFQSRYHSVSQSQTDVEGVVVVFLGARGGVAAATLADIRQWVEGGLPDEAFVNRCSLDPATEFRAMRLD